VLDHGVRHLEGIGAAGELRLQLVEVAEVDDDRTEHVGASAMDVKHDHVGGRDVLEFDVDEGSAEILREPHVSVAAARPVGPQDW